MKELGKRLGRLLIGLFLYGLGIVITMNASIGFAPWEVFHKGISLVTGITIGTANILVGLTILVVMVIFKEKLGLGTVCNMLLIGVFMDLIIKAGFVPKSPNLPIGILEMFAGLFVIAFASYFYIGSGLGAGPRDSLMVLITRKTRWPVGVVRTGIEVLVTGCGWLLGGPAGYGTLIAGVMAGFCIQTTFKLLRFDPTKIAHLTFTDALALLKH